MLNLLRKNDDLGHQTTIWMAPLGRIADNPYQTRQRNDADHVLNLAASIVQMARSLPDSKGLQQLPVGRLVRYGDGHAEPEETYGDDDLVRTLLAGGEHVVELAFGHSRRLAFLVLGRGVGHVFPELSGAEQVALGDVEYDAADYQAMPVLLRPLTDQEMWEHAITENAQRRDLTAIEEAIAIERARKDFGMTYDQAGKMFGKTRGAAANLVRLLQLPEEYQQAILDGRLTERHGRALLKLTPYPDAFAQWPVTVVADHNVNYLDKSIGFTATTFEMRQAAQAKPQGRRLLADEAVKLVGTWIDEQWARAMPDNPSHTNGTFWQELTRWMRENVDEIWYESDLKFAIKQVAYNRAVKTADSTPEPARAAVLEQAASGETVTKARAQEIIEQHKPIPDAGLTALLVRYVRQNFASRDEALKFLINRSNVSLNRLEQAAYEQRVEFDRPGLLRAVDAAITLTMQAAEWRVTSKVSPITASAALRNADDPISQSPVQPELAVVDTLRLIEWQTMFNEAVTALGEWATECGHRTEAGAAARALRVVVERIERDLNG